MDGKHNAIVATICEDKRSRHKVMPILPEPPGSPSLAPFPSHDPFSLRRAVVPVLLKERDGVVRGMGTAFHIDGCANANASEWGRTNANGLMRMGSDQACDANGVGPS